MSTAYRIDMVKVFAKIRKTAICFAAVLLFWAAFIWFGLGMNVSSVVAALGSGDRAQTVSYETEAPMQCLENVEVLAAGLE